MAISGYPVWYDDVFCCAILVKYTVGCQSPRVCSGNQRVPTMVWGCFLLWHPSEIYSRMSESEGARFRAGAMTWWRAAKSHDRGCVSTNKRLIESGKRGLYKCQKRPILGSKEAYTSVKRVCVHEEMRMLQVSFLTIRSLLWVHSSLSFYMYVSTNTTRWFLTYTGVKRGLY